MVIKDVKDKDSGQFECQVSGPKHSSLNKKIHLQVIGMQKIVSAKMKFELRLVSPPRRVKYSVCKFKWESHVRFSPADWWGSYFPFKVSCWLAGRESFNPHTSPGPGPGYWVRRLKQVPQYYKEYDYIYTSNNHLRCTKSRQDAIGNYHFCHIRIINIFET